MPPRNPTFGLTSSGRGRGRGRGGGGSNTRFTGNKRGSWQKRGGGGSGGGAGGKNAGDAVLDRADDGNAAAEKFEEVRIKDEIDEKMGFWRWDGGGGGGVDGNGDEKVGWLVNMHQTLVQNESIPGGQAAIDLYFIQDDGGMFKSTVPVEPYFYVGCKLGTETIVEEWLVKKYEGLITRVSRHQKEDLKLPNHLLGHRPTFLRLTFQNTADLFSVRREIVPLALANRAKLSAVDAYAEVIQATMGVEIDGGFGGDAGGGGATSWAGAEAEGSGKKKGRDLDPSECLNDVREYDINYYLRAAIDLDIRVGLWYTVLSFQGTISITNIPARVKRAEPVVMAFDIETSKAPLKFPVKEVDQIMMISYMVDGQGYLITNREIVSEDIEDFEYTPKPEYEGPFVIFNEPDEPALIRRWFEHIRDVKPTVMATFNGDAFDFPFVEARANVHGISMFNEIGFARDSEDEFKSRSCVHMDCFRWVKRDSYLPQGSQGLKAVTTYKLGYQPIELDPELMTPYAIEQPQILAQYSVSDAVATYYLYMTYVHPFVFSLCNIIPLNPDEVLRKGTGTLCETLLMVEAHKGEIIMPNRYEEPHLNTYEGHLLSSETYVGGHVEALEAGVFRSDIPTQFKVTPDALQGLIDDLDAALEFSIKEEGHLKLEDVENYGEVKGQIQSALEELRDNPSRMDNPLIYHLDVAAMYPNIMLSNRLQPDSIVDEAMCATCDFNRPDKTCDRRMDWAWRGEYFPAKRDEFNMVKNALEQESFPPKWPKGPHRRFVDLSQAEQSALLEKRLGDYSRKVYRKTHETKIVTKEAIVCQRENPFYIDTVRAFRDRRYEYKGLHKTWKKNLDGALGGGVLAEITEAKGMIVIYDSLQLAHKCILNSFYGYVMRKGARWYSMEMAGITCLTGATIIQMARQLVEQIGRPLELDTDGIWCMLPGAFPEDFNFKLKGGKKFGVSYPCTMLNHLVHAKFTNHQYHDMVDKTTGRYEVHSENSIFFELDGPYKAMVLPSSKEEDKLLKKRYAVFNHDNSLAELKGFEIKRRGELQLIKIFQGQIFEKFLLGTTTEECYAAVAQVADQWLDVLQSKASSLEDEELVELIAENRSMSKTLAEYGAQKSTSISTARRLAEFLGDQMTKDKGLACKFIISAKPNGAPVTERAVPVAIFDAEPAVKQHFLRKWLKDNSLVDFDLRSILDWGYYTERLGSVIQKLITIPAALQKVSNPVPRIRHPDWLHKRVAAKEDKFQQHKLTDMFSRMKAAAPPADPSTDIEDFGRVPVQNPATRHLATVTRKGKGKGRDAEEQEEVEEELPDARVDYSGWIRVMRKRWKKQREEKTTVKQTGGQASTSQNRGSVSSMFRQRTHGLSSLAWEVVQISPSNRLGVFNLWLSIDGNFQKVKLKVPRQFYLNLRTPPEKGTFNRRYSAQPLVRTLPRNHPCLHLFQVTVDEDDYVQEESHFSNLINNPNVDGVYELQIPLVVRALLSLGVCCSVDKSVKGGLNRGLDKGFDLKDLEKASPTLSKRPYLNGGDGIRYLYLYHSSSSGRHLLGLFSPDQDAAVFSIDGARARQPITHLPAFYAERVGKLPPDHGRHGVFGYERRLDFQVSYHGNEAAGFKALNRALATFASQRGQPTMLVVFSSQGQQFFEQRAPAVLDFPVVMLPSSPEAGSPLMWLGHTSRRMVVAYLAASDTLKHHMEVARHHDVPVGNLSADSPLFLADIDFARRLQSHDVVLWWSLGSRPDLGGVEDDANTPQAIDDLASPEFTNPGCYSNVTFRVSVADLAINSVLQSALVNEMEGSGSGSMAFDSASHNLDDYSKGTAHASLTLGDAVLSTQTFGILKSMVKAWYLHKARFSDDTTVADMLVDNFWRWISSSSSAMFDPGLHRFLHGLMKKTFIQLLAEFKRLGSTVVHANFNEIVLLTSKPSTANTVAYAAYLLTAANSHELFRHLDFKIVNFWELLVWMDPQNYGGVPVLPENAGKDVSPVAFDVDLEWNIKSFLPPALQIKFDHAIFVFLEQMYKAKRSAQSTSREPLRAIQPSSTQVSNGAALPTIDPAKEKEVGLGRTIVGRKLTRLMLTNVQDILASQKLAPTHHEIADDLAFPLLPGAHLKSTNPALEFIKSTCHVFSLARELSTEVQVLKRNLLDFVGVREFADIAVFRNPCEVLKLPAVICTQCHSAKDLDLCRDPERLPQLFEMEDGDGRRSMVVQPPRSESWLCEKGHVLDSAGIEIRLVEFVQRLVLQYQLQDLICSKCKQIRDANLTSTCNCGGAFLLTVGKAELGRTLALVVSLAEYHQLDLLLEYSAAVLASW